jgi:transcriptional regulator
MYQPSHFAETDVAVLHALIRAHPLATWAAFDGAEIAVNHIPFLLDATRGEQGVLLGHVARANDIWRRASTTVPSVLVFQGANSYVSPSWYPSKHAHGKAVPTWNYAVVHAHGTPRAVDDKAWLLDFLHRLTDTHEAGQAVPWKVADAPADYIDRTLENIVGIEIPIVQLTGKWKVSQNRPEPDRLGVVAGLLGRDTPQAAEMAALVERHTKPRGGR